jgi:hypothetical protein
MTATTTQSEPLFLTIRESGVTSSHFDQFVDQIKIINDRTTYQKILCARRLCQITPMQFQQLLHLLQNTAASNQPPKKYIKEVMVAVSTPMTSQEKTIVSGHFNMVIKESTDQIIKKKMLLDRAKNYFDRRGMDMNDIVSTIATQLSTSQLPYVVTGLTAKTLLTNTFDSDVRMRPDSISLLKNIVGTSKVLTIDSFRSQVHIEPFKAIITTLSYVNKQYPNEIGSGFYVRTLDTQVESFGDSYYLQSSKTTLELQNTTPQTMTFGQLDVIMHKLCTNINSNFDDLLRRQKKRSVIQVQTTSVYDSTTTISSSLTESKLQRIRSYLPHFSELYDDIESEIVFDTISAIREYYLETKSLTMPDYNASTRQKYKLLQKLDCACLEKHVLVYGSGSITSALSVHLLSLPFNGTLELVDPIIDTVLQFNHNSELCIASNQTYETYAPLHNHYCLIVNDIGSFESGRTHFQNDNRLTNYYSRLIYDTWHNKTCNFSLHMGFGLGLFDLPVKSIWHFKPHNPEFWVNTGVGADTKISPLLRQIYIDKLEFNAIRLRYWRSDKMVYGVSKQFPNFNVFDYFDINLPFPVTHGKSIPYSNSISKGRLIPYSKPNLGFMQPHFNSSQQEILKFIETCEDADLVKKKLDESELTPFQKFSLIAFTMGKRITVIGSRMKRSLGEEYGKIKDKKIDATTTANASYLTINKDDQDRLIHIKTITPKMSDIAVDYEKIHKTVTSRAIYGPITFFSF